MCSDTNVHQLFDEDDSRHQAATELSRRQMSDPKLIRDFVLGGHATVTLVSGRTGDRFTYRITTPPGDPGAVSHFVALLTNPDNERGYTYLGHVFRKSGDYWHGKKSKIHQGAPGAAAWTWFYDKVIRGQQRPEALRLEVWHEGRCGRCGRKLTVPESIERGIGPECYSRMGG